MKVWNIHSKPDLAITYQLSDHIYMEGQIQNMFRIIWIFETLIIIYFLLLLTNKYFNPFLYIDSIFWFLEFLLLRYNEI